MSAGLLTTWTPASASAAIFSAAVPLPPAMIAPGVAHPASRRRGLAGDEADDRLLEVRLDPGGRVLLGVAADLADHHDRLGRRVAGEQRQRVDEARADQRIAADADAGRLAEAEPGQLVDRLVGQRAALRHDADAALPCRCARE